MQHLFQDHAFPAEYAQFRLLGHILFVVSRSTQKDSSISGDAAPETSLLETRARDLLQLAPESSPGRVAVEHLLDATSQAGQAPSHDHLLKFVEDYLPIRRTLSVSHEVTAQILHPSPNAEKPHEFLYSFPHRVELSVELQHGADPASVVVQVTLPNKTVQRFWPPPSDFSTKGQAVGRALLSTSLHLHISRPWTDAAAVEILIARAITCDPSSPDHLILRAGDGSVMEGHGDAQQFLALSAPFPYFIHPRRS